MSSINPHFTFSYSQPEEYRFSHDSVFLARRVFEAYTQKDGQLLHGLDLCSGCGVVGLDFLFHLRNSSSNRFARFDFMEIQEIYAAHFATNVNTLGSLSTTLQFVNKNYSELQKNDFTENYDLILCNPPYFHPGQGKLSPSEFKNRCRFFIDSDFTNLLRGIENTLKPQGQGFILLRDQKEHGWSSLEEARKILSSNVQIKIMEDIRGTHLVQITKIPRCS